MLQPLTRLLQPLTRLLQSLTRLLQPLTCLLQPITRLLQPITRLLQTPEIDKQKSLQSLIPCAKAPEKGKEGKENTTTRTLNPLWFIIFH